MGKVGKKQQEARQKKANINEQTFLSKYRDLGKMESLKWLTKCFYTALDVVMQSVSYGHFSGWF